MAKAVKKIKVKNISLRVVMLHGVTRILPNQVLEVDDTPQIQRLIKRKILTTDLGNAVTFVPEPSSPDPSSDSVPVIESES